MAFPWPTFPDEKMPDGMGFEEKTAAGPFRLSPGRGPPILRDEDVARGWLPALSLRKDRALILVGSVAEMTCTVLPR